MSKNKITYDDMVEALNRGICEINHIDKKGNSTTTYATMNVGIANEFGFGGFRLTEKRLEEDRKLELVTVANLQDKKYARISLKKETLISFRSIRGRRIPSRTEGYNVLKISYEQLVTMLIKGKVTVKFIKKDGSERTMVATRNPQLIKVMSEETPEFGSLVEDKKRGLISVFDCEKKAKRIINYRTLVELEGFEGPEDSQVKIIRVIYRGTAVVGYSFNLMGFDVTLDLEDSFRLIESGVCLNARIEGKKITYAGNIPRVDKMENVISLETAVGILKDKTHYIITGEARGILAEVQMNKTKKTQDLRKLIDLLNTEYGYNIPYDATEISIEFK